MQIKISRKMWIMGAVVLFILLTIAIWFNAEKIVLYSKINSPLSKPWAAIQLTNGEILYGHIYGVTSATIGLRDVFILQKLVSAEPAGTSTSTTFSVSNVMGPTLRQKLVPLKQTSFLFINRSAVVYWKFVNSDDPAYSYLK